MTFDETYLPVFTQERLAAGLNALTLSNQLNQAAQAHAEDMATHDYFSHTGLNGSSPGERISATGYVWRTYGENIAYGYASAESVMQGWMNSDGHRGNIKGRPFRTPPRPPNWAFNPT